MDAKMDPRTACRVQKTHKQEITMNPNFLPIIAATPDDRRDLFLSTANRMGTTLQNVEKDFWVCWVLNLLFSGQEINEPRLLFKGGTSLSKAYGLISRFSEDIDITVFREDIGQNIQVSDLEKLSGKQQRLRLNNLKQACQHYIQGPLKERLNQQIKTAFYEAGITFDQTFVNFDLSDPDGQTLLVHYPSVSNTDDYVKPTVKIEAGAKSALDPHQQVTIKPYVDHEISTNSLVVPNVVTIDAERTFWDKVVILHGLRRWYDNRKQLRQEGHRVSRHYYDINKLLQSEIGQRAKAKHSLALDCVRHAQMFFNIKDLDLKTAHPGSFALIPTPEMTESLKRDYQAMTGMIFGEIPNFEDVINTVRQLEHEINQ
jgi:predicted nucleotidyltransferase component of viral defense system